MHDYAHFDPGRSECRSAWMPHVLAEVIDELEARGISSGWNRGLTSGHHELDRVLGRLQPKDLVVIAGRAKGGTTALGLSIAAHVGTQKGLPVLYLALSESAHEITERMLLLESGVDRARFRDARLRTKDWLALGKAISRIHDGEIFIDDTPCQTTADIRTAARTTLNAYGLALIIIDRLEFVCGDASSDSWAKGRSKVALELKAIATEFAVPVVGLSRLPDDVGSQSPRRPEIDESILGGFHEDSDAILLIEDNRKAEGDSESEEFPGIPRTVRIRCLKTKSGHTGSIEIGKISLGMA